MNLLVNFGLRRLDGEACTSDHLAVPSYWQIVWLQRLGEIRRPPLWPGGLLGDLNARGYRHA